ncbi:DeoR family transcriptional regulator [Arachidicoccus ginsenosidimutans]|uniref:DeoR/GlpR family DNA-binding transcription regulator n=1 Tax=Arachidicoccus sp. BS20 TaxID=1850526 RepID=UPI0007F1265F|nr:DeoR/GlpR family DNA-binding transcription regulator [Arachidicoccus sp. BS20]ANI88019.1 DeoR family transcriptional regulator [Arachidicoccus sp. BS20]
MLKKERQAYIIQQINIHNKILSSDLSTQLDVSEDTIRRDLQELDSEGKLTKVHGGALSKAFQVTLNNKNIYSLPEKKIIAHKAASLIKDGMFIILGGGTTIRELVKALPENLSATFITPSIPTALALLNHPAIEVIFIGNKLSKTIQMAVDIEAAESLKSISADYSFIGTNSIDADAGITDLEWESIEIKKAIMRSSRKTIALAISEKLGSVQHLKVCDMNDISILITELPPDDQRLKKYKNKGVEII